MLSGSICTATGRQGIDVRANERVNFVTYSDKRALYEVGEEMSGLTFGKRGGSLMCRIYDKTRESKDKGHDWWPEVWGASFDPEQKVQSGGSPRVRCRYP